MEQSRTTKGWCGGGAPELGLIHQQRRSNCSRGAESGHAGVNGDEVESQAKSAQSRLLLIGGMESLREDFQSSRYLRWCRIIRVSTKGMGIRIGGITGSMGKKIISSFLD